MALTLRKRTEQRGFDVELYLEVKTDWHKWAKQEAQKQLVNMEKRKKERNQIVIHWRDKEWRETKRWNSSET